MQDKRLTLYSLDNQNYYDFDTMRTILNLTDWQLKDMSRKGKLYKIINGCKINKVHLSKSAICKISFIDCDNVTIVKPLKKVGQGELIVMYQDIKGHNNEMILTNVEFVRMFGFLVVFTKTDNTVAEQKKAVGKYGKGVEFI